MPNMSIVTVPPPRPNPLGAGVRAVSEQVSRQRDRDVRNTERRALIEGERLYATGQLEEQRAFDQARREQEIKDQEKIDTVKSWFGPMMQLSNQVELSKRPEFISKVVHARLLLIGMLNNETEAQINGYAMRILGYKGPSESSPVVSNLKKQEDLFNKNMEQNAIKDKLSFSQMNAQLGDMVKKFSRASQEPGELSVLQYKGLQKEETEARAMLWREQNPKEGVEVDETKVLVAKNKLSAIKTQLRNVGKQFGVKDSRNLPALPKPDAITGGPPSPLNLQADAFDVANQIRELIKTETDPVEKKALRTMLKNNDIEAMREMLGL